VKLPLLCRLGMHRWVFFCDGNPWEPDWCVYECNRCFGRRKYAPRKPAPPEGKEAK